MESTWLVRINRDGTLEFAEGYTPTREFRRFLETIATLSLIRDEVERVRVATPNRS